MNWTLRTLTLAVFASGGLVAQDEPSDETPAEDPPAETVAKPTALPFVSDKPLVQTEIEAESLRAELTEEAGYLIGVGSVRLIATNLEINCDKIEVFTDVKDKDGNDTIGDVSSINKIIATGNVKIVQEQRIATAGLAEVYPNDDFILLDKDPILYQGSITIDGTGAQLKIHRGNGRVEWIGDPNNKIHITAPPIEDLGFEKNKESIVPDEANGAINADAATSLEESESESNARRGNNRRPRNN